MGNALAELKSRGWAGDRRNDDAGVAQAIDATCSGLRAKAQGLGLIAEKGVLVSMAMGMGLRLPRSESGRGHGGRQDAVATGDAKNKKKLTSAAWKEAKR